MKKVRYPFVLNYKRADKGPERLCHAPMITCWWAHALSYFLLSLCWNEATKLHYLKEGGAQQLKRPEQQHVSCQALGESTCQQNRSCWFLGRCVCGKDRSTSLSQPEETIHQDFFQQTLLLWFQGPLKSYCDFLGKGRPWPRHTNLLVHLKVSAVTVNK